jgi:hypothetical protein
MIEFFARPMADAFMQVGVYVAVMVAFFGWLRWRYGDRFTAGLTRHRRVGPLVGALLGVSPGCGGAIVLMPLYARGKVSFGTVVAALTATMGDSSWVVIAANPLLAMKIHALLLVVGLATGYAVDLLGVEPASTVRGGFARLRRAKVAVPASFIREEASVPASAGEKGPSSASVVALTSGGSGSGPSGGSVGFTPPRWTRMSLAFWGVTTPAFLISVPVAFQALDPGRIAGPLGGVDPYLAFGCCGTLIALVIFALGKGRLADDSLATAEASSAREALRHSAREASFITVWVTAAYLSWEILSATTGFDGSQLALAGVAGVFIGALIGLIPGCAVQIVLTGSFVAGGVPLTTLVANAVSQDGDALIPLAALHRRAAGLATVVTTIPAVLVGLTLLALMR